MFRCYLLCRNILVLSLPGKIFRSRAYSHKLCMQARTMHACQHAHTQTYADAHSLTFPLTHMRARVRARRHTVRMHALLAIELTVLWNEFMF